MGKDRQAEANAAAARETARQFDELRRKAEKVEYDEEEVLNNLKRASELNPELLGLYEAVQNDPSALEKMSLDPRFEEIQKGNLEAIQSMAEESGFSSADLAKRRALQRQVAGDEQARQKSIVQEMMQRGQSGSGTELLARLGSSQASAQRQAEASDRLAMDSSEARKAAIQQASNAASGLSQQQYNRENALASARDQIAQFNAMQRTGTANKNLDLRQAREDQKVQQQQNYYGNVAQAKQQTFANEMSKLGLQGNFAGNQGQFAMQGNAKQANKGAMIGTIAGAGLGAMAGPQGAAAGAGIGGQIGGMFGNDGGVKYAEGGIRHKYYEGTDVGQFIGDNALTDDQMAGRQAQADYANRDISAGKQAMGYGEKPTRSTSEAGATFLSKLGLGKTDAEKFDANEFANESAFDDKSNQEILREDMGVKKVNGETLKKDNSAAIAGALGAIGKSLASSQPTQQAAPKLNLAQADTKVTNMGGFKIEDGGVISADDMRDQLMGQIKAFANGGLKYQDGGIEEDAPEEEGKNFGYRGREILEAALDRQADDYDEVSDMLNEKGDAYAEGGINEISPELRQAAHMLRGNSQPAPGAPMPGGQPPMPQMAPPMPPQGAPMAPQGMPMPPQGMAPQQPPMPPQMPPQGMPQGQAMADGGMAYEDGGEGTLIPGESYAGDELPDRINSGEMVLNVEQQDRLNDALMELKRLKSRERTDKMLSKGEIEANPMQQESLMSFVRGEIDVDELPNERVVKEPSMGEPSGRMAELLNMVSKKRRG